MVKRFILLILSLVLIAGGDLALASNVDKVLVKKGEQMMYLLFHGKVVKKYHVVFGSDPHGHKQQEGDEKTPEGVYVLDYKKSDSAFYKAIHISYPNEQDRMRAKQRGVDPGGLIMIHGQKNGFSWLSGMMQNFNWTSGCVAVNNRDMDEIWALVKIGTPIEIVP